MTWVRVEGNCRCTLCGDCVPVTWRWFPKPAQWTLAYCEPCVEATLA